MERIDRILADRDYQNYIKKNNAAEEERIFCRHNMEHFLDVARIGWIINLEEQLDIYKEYIYAAALLHDIGRHLQYESGTSHEKASAQLAPVILERCGFDREETAVIVDAIQSHRDASVAYRRDLTGVLYRADKASRACFACSVCEKCNWSEEKKNLQLRY